MQFQGLSTSYGASNPRDTFIVQALVSRAADDADRQHGDLQEERVLETREERTTRIRRERRLSGLTDISQGDLVHDDDDSDVVDEDVERLSSISRGDDDGNAEADAQQAEFAHDRRNGAQQRKSNGPCDERMLSPRSADAQSSPRILSPSPASTSSRRSSVAHGPRSPNQASERSPLLPPLHKRDEAAGVHHEKVAQNPFTSPAAGVSREEFAILFRYTIPIFLTHLLEYSLLLSTIISVGHIGTAELAAASLGSMTTNMCALSIIQGLCAALDTLCSQACASPFPERTSLYALRTAFITGIVLVPASAVLCHGERLFLGMGQDPEVARLAGSYLQVLTLGLPAYAGFEICRRWLQAQGLMHVPTLALVVAAPLNIALNWLLAWGPDNMRLGFIGAPMATAISFNIMFAISLAYCVCCAPRRAWGGFSSAIVRDLGPNISLGLAGFASIASSWWAWEIVGIASAYLGTDALGANSVLSTSASLLWQLPYGLSVASSVRVGNLVGAGYPNAARVSSRTSWTFSVLLASINASTLLILRHRWGRIFSSDDRVVELVASILPLVGVFQLADGITSVSMGILRGSGLASLGARINICAYWVVGLPLGLALTFSSLHWQLSGLWTGLAVALAVTAAASSVVIYNIDWQKAIVQAQHRTGVTPRRDDVWEA